MAGLRATLVWPNDIKAAIKAVLASNPTVNADYIYYSDADALAAPATDRYIVITLENQHSEPGYVTGGGNVTSLITGRVTVNVWNRLAIDQFQRANAYLDDSTYGLEPLMRQTMLLLQLFDPVNSDLDFLLTEPMRLLEWQDRPREDREGWGHVYASWEISYLAKVTSAASTAGARDRPTWPDEIKASVKAHLDAAAIVSSDYVYYSDDDAKTALAPATDRYLVLTLATQRVEQGYVAGGGNITPLITGQLTVNAWNRLNVDQFPRADAYLDDATLGIEPLMLKVMQALQLFDPTDINSTFLLTEPMRLLDWSDQPREAMPGWGLVYSSWEVSYLAEITSAAVIAGLYDPWSLIDFPPLPVGY